MKKKSKASRNKNNKSHTIYAIYNPKTDDMAAVNLDYDTINMQLQLNELDAEGYEIVEFDIKVVI